MDELQDNIEQAIRNAIKDVYSLGWVSGANLLPQSGMTVRVTAGTGYDENGDRIHFGSDQSINLSSYRPSTSNREAWCLIAGRFKREFSDPRVDGHGNTVYFRENESFEIVVRKGSEAAIGSATKPQRQAGEIIIGYVRVYNGQTEVAASDISTEEKQVMKGPGDVQADLAAHVARKDNPHEVKASQVPIADTGNHFSATNVEGALAEEAAARKAHESATSVHGATSAATANRIIMRDSQGRAKVAAPTASDDIARKAEVDAVQADLNAHKGSGGSAHALATTSSAGFMSAEDKAKLDGIQSGAEVNQNAFTSIRVQDSSGSAKFTHSADSKTDTYTIREGGGVVITAPADDTIQIAHADTSSQGSVNNSGATVIQGVTLDGYGHVTALKSVQITPSLIGAAPASHSHAWSEISGKPSTFPPSSHTHSASDITSGTIAAARLPSASTSAQGIVQLTSSRTSTSETLALTAKAMNDHRSSGDHDGRYYTKAQVDSLVSSGGYRWVEPSDNILAQALTERSNGSHKIFSVNLAGSYRITGEYRSTSSSYRAIVEIRLDSQFGDPRSSTWTTSTSYVTFTLGVLLEVSLEREIYVSLRYEPGGKNGAFYRNVRLRGTVVGPRTPAFSTIAD